MPLEPGVIDTNILVYAVNADSPHHSAARAFLEEARSPSTTLYITSQIVCEFYSVVTNSRRVAAPCSQSEAMAMITALLSLPGIHVLPTPASALTTLLDLLRQTAVTGSDVFDLQLIATMQANNVPLIYTFNAKDFMAIAGLKVVVPSF